MENIIDQKLRRSRLVLLVDFVIVLVSALALLWAVGYVRPLVISPTDNLETPNSSVLFTFTKGKAVLLDDNPEFTSPEKIYAEDNIVINLKPGLYYWKIQGVGSSEVRTLRIVSSVDLRVRPSSENEYEVVNAGNVALDVSVYRNESIVQTMVLAPEKSLNKSGEKFIGGQHE